MRRRAAVFKPSLPVQGGALRAPRGPVPDAAASTRAGRAACRPVPARRAAATMLRCRDPMALSRDTFDYPRDNYSVAQFRWRHAFGITFCDLIAASTTRRTIL